MKYRQWWGKASWRKVLPVAFPLWTIASHLEVSKSLLFEIYHIMLVLQPTWNAGVMRLIWMRRRSADPLWYCKYIFWWSSMSLYVLLLRVGWLRRWWHHWSCCRVAFWQLQDVEDFRNLVNVYSVVQTEAVRGIWHNCWSNQDKLESLAEHLRGLDTIEFVVVRVF